MSAVEKRGKNADWSARFRVFGKQIRVSIPALSESDARRIRRELVFAFKVDEFSQLDAIGRAVARNIFRKSGYEVPPELEGRSLKEELTLWKAAELFLNYPKIRNSKGRERHIYALKNIVNIWGKERIIKDLWVGDVYEYMEKRSQAGMTNGTVNRELSTLSKFFRVLCELKEIEQNPVKYVDRLSEKSGERVVYISWKHFQEIETRSPDWFRPIVQIIFWSGMRVGEALNLASNHINLSRRMFFFGPEDTKEDNKKKVPIHSSLVPVIQSLLERKPDTTDRVILINDTKGTRPPSEESLKNPWRRIVDSIQGLSPRPRLTDLRHTWRRNAFKSEIPDRISESILGHWDAEVPVGRRYGRWMEDDDLLEAIDRLTVDHGETHIWVSPKPQPLPSSVTNL